MNLWQLPLPMKTGYTKENEAMARIYYDKFLGTYAAAYRGQHYALNAQTFAEATAETKAIIKKRGKA